MDQFRAALAAKDINHTIFTDHALSKFLHARKGDVERAVTLVQSHFAWKKEKFNMEPHEMPTAEQAQHWPLITNRKCPEWTVAWTEPKP